MLRNCFLSIVIPAYNAHQQLTQNLPLIVKFLQEKEIQFEIILVDDGSKYGYDELKGIPGLLVLRNLTNKGKGYSLKKGFEAAVGEFQIFTDADIPFDFEAISDILDLLQRDKADVVIGDRTLKESEYHVHVPAWRNFGSKIISFLTGHFLITGIFDTQCGIKGFTSEAAKVIFPKCRVNRFAADIEILIIASGKNLRIAHIPVLLRNKGKSSLKPINDGIIFFGEILKILFFKITGKYHQS